jgi:hypothetical protein
MKNFKNSESNNCENSNSFYKSADILSCKDLIMSLNEKIIQRKSKEYNFDFEKASSYDDKQKNSGIFKLSTENSLSINLDKEEDEEGFSETGKQKGRKISCQLSDIANFKLEDHENVN